MVGIVFTNGRGVLPVDGSGKVADDGKRPWKGLNILGDVEYIESL